MLLTDRTKVVTLKDEVPITHSSQMKPIRGSGRRYLGFWIYKCQRHHSSRSSCSLLQGLSRDGDITLFRASPPTTHTDGEKLQLSFQLGYLLTCNQPSSMVRTVSWSNEHRGPPSKIHVFATSSWSGGGIPADYDVSGNSGTEQLLNQTLYTVTNHT